jgi:TOBE domain-containing protein
LRRNGYDCVPRRRKLAAPRDDGPAFSLHQNATGPARLHVTGISRNHHAHQCTQPDQGHRRRGQERRDNVTYPRHIGNGQIVTSSITNEAVDDLGIRSGGKVTAVIKASDVMIAVD